MSGTTACTSPVPAPSPASGHPIPSGRVRAHALLLAASALGVLAATGCARPTPLVTVQASGVVVANEATGTYCKGGSRASCGQFQHAAKVLPVHQGDQVGVDVPRSVAEQGWVVSINGVPAIAAQHGHYATLSIPFSNDPLQLSVFKLDTPDAQGQTATLGRWDFVLVPRT